jgi:phasin family protein
MFEPINRAWAEAMDPAHRLMALTVAQTEKLINFQVDAARAYTEFGIEQVRGALSVTDSVAFHDYLSKQQDTAKTLSRKLSDDAHAIAGFSKEFMDGAGDVASDSMQRTPNPAAALLGER